MTSALGSRNMTSHRRLTALVFLMVALALIVGGVISFANTRRLAENDWWITHTHEVLASIDRLQANLAKAEQTQRSYLQSGDETLLPVYQVEAAQARDELKRLQELTADNSDQQRLIESIGPNVHGEL